MQIKREQWTITLNEDEREAIAKYINKAEMPKEMSQKQKVFIHELYDELAG